MLEPVFDPLTFRTTALNLLGEHPPQFTPIPTNQHALQQNGYQLRRFEFDNQEGAMVFGYLLVPDGIKFPAPAVLYHHYHGGQYHLGKDEIFLPRVGGQSPASALTQAGLIVCVIDAYGFGQRLHQGTFNIPQIGLNGEVNLFKHFLWQGKNLFGRMLYDDWLAFQYLVSLPEVDASRVGVTGMSLGGTRATWLSALEERIACVVPIAQMTRYRDFAQSKRYDAHSVYYYLPNALNSGMDMEHLVALSAPRPQLILIGTDDPLSPIEGVRTIRHYAEKVYADANQSDRFKVVEYAELGHVYTSEMLETMVEWLKVWLSHDSTTTKR